MSNVSTKSRRNSKQNFNLNQYQSPLDLFSPLEFIKQAVKVMEQQEQRIAKVEVRTTELEYRQTAFEGNYELFKAETNERINVLESNDKTVTAIFNKPLRAKKEWVLHEILEEEFTIRENGRYTLKSLLKYVKGKAFEAKVRAQAEECIKELRFTPLKNIRECAEDYGRLQHNLISKWMNPAEYKRLYTKQFIMAKLCYSFDNKYRGFH